jgi:PAS domain S-box-containing protein
MAATTEASAGEALARAYADALREYVSGAGEAALARGYEIARNAATAGVGLLELAMVHHRALGEVIAGDGAPPLAMAAQFLAESLSPFEMTLRSYQANARLLGLGESLAQRNAEIDRAREQLRTILDATTAVIYLKDASGRFAFVNRRFLEVFGVGRDEVLGRTEHEVLPAEVAAAFHRDDARVLEARVPQEVEEQVPTTDGPHTWIALKFPLLDAAGEPYGVSCVATDITERRRTEQALQRAREAAERERRLQEELEARDQFLAVASHELKTPLTSLELQMASFVRLARSHPEATISDEKVRARLEATAKQVDRLKVLVKGLLDVARIAAGRFELSRAPMDLVEVVREVLDRVHSRSPLTLDAPRPVIGSWDRSSLEIVVSNVVSNAVKFGEEKPIEVAVAADGEVARLRVRDHGMGISAADQDRIFGRFERAVSERHFGGFGVGLWVARQAVEAHGGRIAVSSRPGEGSAFTIELPLRDGAPR